MHNNGVTHMTVPGDMEGVAAIVEWLAYIPKARLSLLALSRAPNIMCMPRPPGEGGPPARDPHTGPSDEASGVHAHQGSLRPQTDAGGPAWQW